MLHLYQSNRLEHLAALMVKIQSVNPPKNPIATQKIIINSQGMRRYISQYLAKEQGISANIHFQLPADLSWQLMCENLPNLPTLNPFASEVMRWRLLTLFLSTEFTQSPNFQAAYSTLKSYLNNGTFAAYQLAGQLADIFDQYLVYRPDWLEQWANQQMPTELKQNTTAIWQAQIWCYLDDGNTDTPHRAKLWQLLLKKLSTSQAKQENEYYVFGIASLAPMYLTLLQKLAETSEVHILALNPSEQYWGNVIEPSTILKNNGLDLSEQGHPLLASLGKQGRDFFNQLTEAQAQNDLSTYDEEPLSGSLLHTLQYHIQTQTLPETALENNWLSQHQNHIQQTPLLNNTYQTLLSRATTTEQQHIAQLKADNSIQIHAAHSPLRELQILKDQLLTILNQRPELQVHDIAVLTPNIEPYSPFIEAIFGKHCPDGQAIPYSVADLKRSSNNQLILALTQTLDLINSRFEVNKLLALLDHPIIANRFNIQKHDITLIHDTINQLNIHWGADIEQRQAHGDNNNLYTWQQGLNRLIAGWLLPETPNKLWHNISPFTTNPSHQYTFGQFIKLVQLLTDTHKQWQQSTNINEWITRLRTLINQLISPADEDQTALQQLEQSLNKWLAQTEAAQFGQKIDLNIIIQHIKHCIDEHSDSGFLKGGITFCSMVPMRSLPFKVLCLLGLNDGDFPRADTHSSFDLINQHTRAGDRARRNDDRYLFLESILSAREILYLSYIGKDIRDDAEKAPSVLINELIDTIATQTAISASTLLQNWVTQHPLQPFSAQYFDSKHLLSSSRQDYAHALNQPLTQRPTFIETTTNHQYTESNTNNQPISQNDFIRFWRNPSRYYLQQLNWRATYTNGSHDDMEPFQLTSSRQISDTYLKASRQQQNIKQVTQALHAQSQFPPQLLGKYTEQYYQQQIHSLDKQLLQAPKLPTQSGILSLTTEKLHYQLNQNTKYGQIIYADQFLGNTNKHNNLTAPDKIELLLRHLIYCSTNSSGSHLPTIFINLNEVITLPAIEKSLAITLLNQWLTYYQQGQQKPLPFFPRVNLAAISMLIKKDKTEWDNVAIQAAATKYHGRFNVTAQSNSPEIKLIYGRQSESQQPYETKLFQELCEHLLLPLKDCIMAIEKQ